MIESDARVLVVDDERFFREAIVETLEPQGCECIVCEDGEQAVDRLEDPSIGVVVLDIRLPGIDGIEVLRRIRDQRPELRVIMLSASTDQDLVLEALRLGACDYLAKPLHDEELTLAVYRAFDGHRAASGWGSLRDRLNRLVEAVQLLTRDAAGLEGAERVDRLRRGAAEAASEILGARKTSVMLVDASGTELEVVAAVGRDLAPDEMDRVAVGSGAAGRVLEDRQPVLVQDVASEGGSESREESERYETCSFALAPLESGVGSFGVLCATDLADGREFTHEDLALLRLLAMQVAEQMGDPWAGEGGAADLDESGGAFDLTTPELSPPASEGNADDAELARLICDAIVSEVEPRRIIDAVLSPIAQVLDAAPVSIFLVDGSSGELVLEGEHDGGTRAERPKLDVRRGLTGQVLQNGTLVASPDPELDARFDAEIDTPEDGRPTPLLCIPLRLRDRVFGIVRIFFEEGAVPSARTGEVLAAALSAAARNVLLYRSLVDSIAEVAKARRQAGGES